jgi:nicotinate-nucleotide pyrophosphorylase
MSGWGLGWFGGGQAKKEAPKKAILQLRGQLEMLNKREKHLQNQMDEQDTIARKYVTSNKNGEFVSIVPTRNTTDTNGSGQGSVTAEEAV